VVYPVTTGAGPINNEVIDKYKTIAVFKFNDSPGAPTSGSMAASALSSHLSSRGFTVVERARLQQIFEEQRLQLSSADENTNALKVGKLAGAKAVVIGDVTQWVSQRLKAEDGKQRDETFVALSLRLVDVESGTILFTGDGHFPDPSAAPPQNAAHMILRALVTRLAVKVGLVSTGRAGFNWDMQQRSGRQVFIVTDFDQDSPAYRAGLRSGDIILSCNGSANADWKTQWDSMRDCQVEAGQVLSLEVGRGEQRLIIKVTAADRYKQPQ
jgi:hypothetical protein